MTACCDDLDDLVEAAVSARRWSICTSSTAYDRALAQARGAYQRGLIVGRESLCGSTLGPRRVAWVEKYRASRDAVLQRLRDCGIDYQIIRHWSGKRILVIGTTTRGRKK